MFHKQISKQAKAMAKDYEQRIMAIEQIRAIKQGIRDKIRAKQSSKGMNKGK